MKGRRLRILLAVAVLLGLGVGANYTAHAQPQSHTFPETGYTVTGRFLQYWQENGGLAQFGYPISDAIGELSPIDGQLYTVQYFERALFEYHPGNNPPNDVLLALLGNLAFHERYPWGNERQLPGNRPDVEFVYFPETGKYVCCEFLDFWRSHGGLPQQGLPITDFTMETSLLDGHDYLVQYFERAVYEYHPESPSTNYVLLSQLGTFRFNKVYAGSSPRYAPPVAVPPAIATATPVPPRANPTATRSTAPPPQPPRPTSTRTTGGGGVCGVPYSPSGPDVDCGHFATQAQAQCFFRAAGGPARDPHRLDADNDGIACESLP